MIRPNDPLPPIRIAVHAASTLDSRLPAMTHYAMSRPGTALSRHPAWLNVLRNGLQHEVYAIEALTADGRTCGLLPLSFVSSMLFGRFLVSLPYLNSNGTIADCPDVQTLLIRRAIELADELNVRHLELRHERPSGHPQLNEALTSKVHLRLDLPTTTDLLWKQLDGKVRNQVRKGEKQGLRVEWSGSERLDEFYEVVSHNMRDLGTPVYSIAFFAEIMAAFPTEAELCIVRADHRPVAAALLLHGRGVSEVPTASSLREFNASCANMLMYRSLLDRSLARGQQVFDFGRSTVGGNTHRFKKQWGAADHPAVWEYYLRRGDLHAARPENPRYQRMIRLWQRLPVPVTRVLGPRIVRGIP